MATKKHSGSAADIEFSEERVDVALQATWEIDGLLELIVRESQSLEAGNLALRGLAIRAKALNSAVMSALGEDDMPDATLRAAVSGQSKDAEASHG